VASCFRDISPEVILTAEDDPSGVRYRVKHRSSNTATGIVQDSHLLPQVLPFLFPENGFAFSFKCMPDLAGSMFCSSAKSHCT